MADHWGHVIADAARLEAALERLARLAPQHRAEPAPPPTAELACRLDALIAELRATLRKDAAD